MSFEEEEVLDVARLELFSSSLEEEQKTQLKAFLNVRLENAALIAALHRLLTDIKYYLCINMRHQTVTNWQ